MDRETGPAMKLPGLVASIVMILLTALWTYWGIGEMYHEGWWGAWYHRLPYLAPVALTLGPTLLAFRWPLVGGTLVLLLGVFAAFFFGGAVAILGVVIALVGAGFLVDGAVRRRPAVEAAPPAGWWVRNWRYALALGLCLAIVAVVSAERLPVVLTRQDDGNRGERLIEGNGVTLVWAPEGPGWNWRQPWGGYLSWQHIALYGKDPVGITEKPGSGEPADGFVPATSHDMRALNLCTFLSDDGLRLMEAPQNLWRMPSVDELVRSLGRHGENAGCAWNGERGPATCRTEPDKESPLWATDSPAIYYWAADDRDSRDAWFVSYNGYVNSTFKAGGNPRHSHRCVRDA
jgi:hypothetical protein